MKTRRRKQYFVYITASINKVIYIGYTDNLLKRIYQHKHGHYENAFTKKYKVTKLIYWEKYDKKESALRREKELKGWKRNRKVALIEKYNEYWRDVYNDLIELHKASSKGI